MTPNDAPSLFLSKVSQRLAKIRTFKEYTGSLPYKDYKTRGRVSIPADKRSAMEAFLTQIADRLRIAAPYQFDADKVPFVSKDKKHKIYKNLILPSSVTWVHLPAHTTDQETESGVLLVNNGNEQISITLFLLLTTGERTLSFNLERTMGTLLSVVNPFSLTAMAKRKLTEFGKHEAALLIVPDIVFDGNQITVPIRGQEKLMPLYWESPNAFPQLLNYREHIETYDRKEFEYLRDGYKSLAESSLLFANEIAKQDIEPAIKSSQEPIRNEERKSVSVTPAIPPVLEMAQSPVLPARSESLPEEIEKTVDSDFSPQQPISTGSSTTPSNSPSLLLNEVLGRLTKIQFFRKYLPHSTLVYNMWRKEKVSAEEASQIESSLGKIETNLRSAASYQFRPDAAKMVIGVEQPIDNIVLPSPAIWIDNFVEEDNEATSIGTLLVDSDAEEIHITLFIKELDNSAVPRQLTALPSLTNVPQKIDAPAVAQIASSFLEKLNKVGHYPAPLLVVPAIVFNKKTATLHFSGENKLLPFLIDHQDGTPFASNYALATEYLDQNTYDALTKNWFIAAEKALKLAQAVATKQAGLIVKLSPRPKAFDDVRALRSGKAPKRKASIVSVDRNLILEHAHAQTVEKQIAATQPEPLVADKEGQFTSLEPLPVSDALPEEISDTIISPLPLGALVRVGQALPEQLAVSNSLAQFVIDSGKHAQNPLKGWIKEVGSKLLIEPSGQKITTPRFVLDRGTEDVLKELYKVPLQEFLAYFSQVTMPTNTLWIEVEASQQSKIQTNGVRRVGFLFIKDGTAFKVKYVTEWSADDSSERHTKEVIDTAYVRNGLFVDVDPTEFLLEANGGKFNYSKHLHLTAKEMDEYSGYYSQIGGDAFRLLIVACSSFPGVGISALPHGPIPPGDLRPIRIELTRPDTQLSLDAGSRDSTLPDSSLTEQVHKRSSNLEPISTGEPLKNTESEISPFISPLPLEARVSICSFPPEQLVSSNSLAQFVIESGKYAQNPLKAITKEIGKKLIIDPTGRSVNTTRFFLENFADALEAIRRIPFGEISGYFNQIIMPSDNLWIEVAVPPEAHDIQLRRTLRQGFLFSKGTKEIRMRFLQEWPLTGMDAPKAKEISGKAYIRDGLFIDVAGVEFIFDETGIVKNFSNAKYEMDNDDLTDFHDRLGMDLYSILILACNNLPGHGLSSLTNEYAPPGDLRPIKLELTRTDAQLLLETDQTENSSPVKSLIELASPIEILDFLETAEPETSPFISPLPLGARVTVWNANPNQLVPSNSLAQFVIDSGKYAQNPIKKKIKEIGGKLIIDPTGHKPFTPRYILDDGSSDIANILREVPIKEFYRYFSNVAMPSDYLWIETTADQLYRDELDSIQRLGLLFSKSGEGIRARLVQEWLLDDHSDVYIKETALGTYFYNRRSIDVIHPEFIFDENGCRLDYSECSFTPEKIKKLDTHFLPSAEDYYRLLIIACSNLSGVGITSLPHEDISLGNLRPIQIELTAQDIKASLEAYTVGVTLSEEPIIEPVRAAIGNPDFTAPTEIPELLPDALTETAETEDGLQAPVIFESVIAAENGHRHSQEVAPQVDVTQPSIALTDDELLERELKRIDAFEQAKAYLLADTQMYLAQALNKGFDRFECRIVLNDRNFPIQLQFSTEVEIEGKAKTRKANFVLDSYAQAYIDQGIPLTLNDAVDLKIAVQSLICNTDGIHCTGNPSASGQRTMDLDTQMPLPVNNYKIARRSNGMYSLIFDARDPYTKKIINPSISLGVAARHEDEGADARELEKRVEYVVDYLHEIGNHRTPEGHRIFVTKRDVITKLQGHLEERGGEWVTIEQKKISEFIPDASIFDSNTLIHVSPQGTQKIMLAPVVLRMDVGGDNPSWHCWISFFIGDKNKKSKGENVRTRTLNLHTQNPALAAARAFETLVGVRNRHNEIIVDGFLPHLQRHMRQTGDEWRVENKDRPQEEVFIGDQPLQHFLDDMMRYERDIGVMLDKREFDEDGNVKITIQALRTLTGDYPKKLPFTPERVHESRNDQRKLVAYTLIIPGNMSDKIEEFIQAVHSHIRWHADEAYSSIALGTDEQQDMRKKPLKFHTSQIRWGVIRAVEALYQEFFGSKLSRNWHKPEVQAAFSSTLPDEKKSHHPQFEPTLPCGRDRFARHTKRLYNLNHILG